MLKQLQRLGLVVSQVGCGVGLFPCLFQMPFGPRQCWSQQALQPHPPSPSTRPVGAWALGGGFFLGFGVSLNYNVFFNLGHIEAVEAVEAG